VVVSAPGKRSADDTKVTDLLYHSHELALTGGSAAYTRFFDEMIGDRYRAIADGVGGGERPGPEGGLSSDLEAAKAKIFDLATAGHSADFAASRGEALNGRLFADLLGWEFVDPAAGDFIQFDSAGAFDGAATSAGVAARLAGVERCVVPGFYGSSTVGGQIGCL
jgi:aspartate kinase